MTYVETDVDDGFLIDAEAWEKEGLWEPGYYHFRVESVEDRKGEEIKSGEFAGELQDYLNLRVVATEQATYNEEGYATGEILELPHEPSRFMKLQVSGPFKDKGLAKYKGLCETALGQADRGVKDASGRYNLSGIAKNLVGKEFWCGVGHFQDDQGTWRDFMYKYYTKKPARKIRVPKDNG